MLTVLAILIKFLLYASALTVIGLSLHWALKLSGDGRRMPALLVPAGSVFLGAVALKLLVANAQLSGSMTEAFSPDTFKWVWRPHATQTYVFLGALLALAGAAAAKWRPGAVFVALAVGVGFGTAGHVQGLETPLLWGLLLALHVVIAGFWFVAPLTLYPTERMSMGEVQRRTALFSSIAVKAIPVLFVFGGLILWQLLGGFAELITTQYGRLLTIKLVAAIILLGFGAMNKFWIAERLAQNLTSGRNLLRMTLRGEVALFAMLLLALALGTTITGPGHAS